MNAQAVAAMIVAVLAAPAVGRGQGTGPQPIDAGPLVGTGAIEGTVTSVYSGAHIPAALVTLDGLAAGAPVRTVIRIAISDRLGRFSFTSLPAGRFLLQVTRETFLAASYGERAPGRAGRPIDLDAGQKLTLQVRMTRGSVIAGAVFDDSGEPLVRARVRALRYLINPNAVRRLRVVAEAQTDDRGLYRFFNLDPGEYLISAAPSVIDAPEMVARALGVQENDDTSALMLEADGSPRFKSPVLAPTFHPGTVMAGEASSIRVNGTDEQNGIDIRLRPVLMTTIQGKVVGIPSGVAAQVLLHNTDPAEETTTLTALVSADGEFALENVAPGRYLVYAQTVPVATQAPATLNGQPVSSVQAVRLTSFDRLHGRTAVNLNAANPPPLTIELAPGRVISGKVVLDLAQPLPGATRPTTITITPAPQPTGLPAFNTSPQVDVDADGNFMLPGIRPGRYLLRASGPGTVRSVMWNGLDTLDFPLEVTTDADVSGVVITLSDRVTDLSGAVTDVAGKPLSGCTVIVAAADRRFWTPGSRRVITTTTSADGRYAFRGLPTGDYRLSAVDDFDPTTEMEPNRLQQLTASATAISLAIGERKVQNLRVSR